ncbi:MAG: hypothetical protein IKW07_02140 [Clostridia bacterium]|nr:hypothetical protein [Clostridia bacterium]
MTIVNNFEVLWDNGRDRFCLYSVPTERQYQYIKGQPCITFGVSYENENYKGCEIFTFFDKPYMNLLDHVKKVDRDLEGSFRFYDMGADTDGFIDFTLKKSRLSVSGRLGASFSSHSLMFSFDADQTLLAALLQSLAL